MRVGLGLDLSEEECEKMRKVASVMWSMREKSRRGKRSD